MSEDAKKSLAFWLKAAVAVTMIFAAIVVTVHFWPSAGSGNHKELKAASLVPSAPSKVVVKEPTTVVPTAPAVTSTSSSVVVSVLPLEALKYESPAMKTQKTAVVGGDKTVFVDWGADDVIMKGCKWIKDEPSPRMIEYVGRDGKAYTGDVVPDISLEDGSHWAQIEVRCPDPNNPKDRSKWVFKKIWTPAK